MSYRLQVQQQKMLQYRPYFISIVMCGVNFISHTQNLTQSSKSCFHLYWLLWRKHTYISCFHPAHLQNWAHPGSGGCCPLPPPMTMPIIIHPYTVSYDFLMQCCFSNKPEVTAGIVGVIGSQHIALRANVPERNCLNTLL